MSIKKITLSEYRSLMKEQGVSIEDVKFICPNCKTLQSANDLIKAGAGSNFTAVQKYLAYSCIGRFNNKKTGCDWTLGGLFKIHELEVQADNGVFIPQFMPATKEQTKEKIIS